MKYYSDDYEEVTGEKPEVETETVEKVAKVVTPKSADVETK